MENNSSASTNGFYGLGIAPVFLEKIIKLGFTQPTPIQKTSIPAGIEGKDIIGIAQTGTGKTLAFCIPMLQQLAQKFGRGLVLVPTRELAMQVNETYQKFVKAAGMRTALLIGGEKMGKQIAAVKKDPTVIVATPGRLIDHMRRGIVSLKDVNVLVLDEADRMLDMGFMPQIEEILRKVPRARQTKLFSATMPQKVIRIAADYMHSPVTTEIAQQGTTADTVTQELFVVKSSLKEALLKKLLNKYTGSVLLFTATKREAHKVAVVLKHNGFGAAEIHSDLTQGQRKEALEGFKTGRYRILVATDIAARGIDVKGIEVVINYDLPEDPENYTHRIGRTGRAGVSGHAISIATPEQGDEVKNIEKLIRMTIAVSEHPEIPSEKLSYNGGGGFSYIAKFGRKRRR